ncbi:hypothetical protein [Pedobacter zeae]|uniref:Uncharacterized protein n=1 Tax=Pedobacter zeae TaxID=1737356 RepID=A0A7W6K9K0_9SPHI|nr:hypothetical protein [Pedobacter zeae]MBB4106640.1 hypothetical protein [Pedobacter zeae]GGH02887.1 hypothetical protein GCM10007422_17600 [Pedobacter zeae]
MTKYIMTSEKFTGTVTFGYDDEFGLLEAYDVQAEMSEAQRKFMLQYMPFHKNEIKGFITRIKGNMEEVLADTSFDAFWEAYDHKVNRKRTLPLYNKLDPDEKLLAIIRVKHYKKYCSRMTRKTVDPERYLKDRYFETDWRSMATK